MDLVTALEQAGHKLIRKTASEMATQCPACGGEDRFCVFTETNRWWCRQCNEKGDLIDYFRRFRGMTFQQACIEAGMPEKIKPINGDKGVQKTVANSEDPPPFESLPKSKPKPKAKPKKEIKPRVIAEYNYVGTDNTLIYQAIRLEPKSFRLRRPGINKKWVWDMKDTPRVLYNLPDVIEEEVIFFTEGEKDADTLKREIGVTATTTPAGTASLDKLQDEHQILAPINNKTVYILSDNDPVGQEYARKVATYIYKNDCKVKVVDLPVDPSGDVSDYFEHMGDEAPIRLGELIDRTKWFEPPSNAIDVSKLLNTEYDKRPAIISHGVLHENEGLLIAGEGGVGKSMLRLEIALHLAMGWQMWHYFDIPRAKRVLIMQYENSERTEQVRLKMMMDGLGITQIPRNGITWIKRTKENRPDLTKKQGVDRLFELVAEIKPHVVVFDCLSNLHSAPENDNVRMRNVMDVFTDLNATLGVSSIVIHHFGKPTEGSQNKYRVRGASGITDWADCVFTYSHKKHESRVLRYLENTKMRNAREIRPLLLERNGNFLSIIVDEDNLCPPTKVVEILNTLGGEVLKQKDLISAIQHETDCSPRSARHFILEAVRRRFIVDFKPEGDPRYKGFKVIN